MLRVSAVKNRRELTVANVFTHQGRNWVADKIREAGLAGATVLAQFVGWGTGAGTALVTDTTLFTEDSAGSPVYARQTCTLTNQTTTTTGDTFQAVGTITSNGTKTITNAGLFDALTTGDLILKGDHSGVPLLLNDQITYTFKLTFS